MNRINTGSCRPYFTRGVKHQDDSSPSLHTNLILRLRIAAGCDCIYCNVQIYGAVVRYCSSQMLGSELLDSRSAGHVITKLRSCGALGGPQPQKVILGSILHLVRSEQTLCTLRDSRVQMSNTLCSHFKDTSNCLSCARSTWKVSTRSLTKRLLGDDRVQRLTVNR